MAVLPRPHSTTGAPSSERSVVLGSATRWHGRYRFGVRLGQPSTRRGKGQPNTGNGASLVACTGNGACASAGELDTWCGEVVTGMGAAMGGTTGSSRAD
jgi:hypothetical protein